MTRPIATIDHVVINARDDLDAAAETYRRLGFTLTPRGHHSLGSINHLAVFGNDYLELIAVPKGRVPRSNLLDWPIGLNAVVFGTNNADTTHAMLAQARADAPLALTRPVTFPDGAREASFRVVNLPPDASPAGRFYFCEHNTRDLVWRSEWQRHENAALGIETVLIAARDPADTGAFFRGLFDDGAVSDIQGGMRLHAGLAQVDVIGRQVLEERFGEALPPDDQRAAALVGLVLRSASLTRTANALRAHGLRGITDVPGGTLVPASQAGGTLLLFRSC